MPVFGGKAPNIEPPLGSIEFLEDVPRRALRAAGKEAAWYSVPAGWPLFKAGEIADGIYFVLSGSLGAFRPMVDGRSEFLGHVRAGEPVGEMALFQGGSDLDGDGVKDDARQYSSEYALLDIELLSLSRKGFQRLITADPELLTDMIRLIMSRMQAGARRNRRTAPKVFCLLSTSPSIDIQQRARSLKDSLARLGSKARIVEEIEGDEKPSVFFDSLEAENDVVILVAQLGDSNWSRLAMRQADRIFR